MRNTMKVAKWEIKRNMKSKSFVIGLFLTPLIFLAFLLVPNLFSSDDDAATTTVYVNDQIGVYDQMEAVAADTEWQMESTQVTEREAESALEGEEDAAYVFVTEESVETGTVTVYTNEETNDGFMDEVQILSGPLQMAQIEQLGLTPEEAGLVAQGIVFEDASVGTEEGGLFSANMLERVVPGAFAALVMLSIVFTGMAIFQSASQEKKDKIAEIILSSLTPSDLMQGKIIGYFVLGLVQVVVFVVIALPVLIWNIDFPIIEHLLVPELLVLLLIAILGYLLYAALFVGIGATMADISTAGNFQGLVMMLPFSPFLFIGPVFSDPSGFVAQLGSYIPFTSPGVLIMRLSLLEEWPWVEIGVAIAILAVSVWIFMKLAGKIFKTGILMYGKNATPGEILKWIKA
ncbi:ABC transporter permease [Planococcus salinus]|uniref:ABC transporter permease n=1 Tax=Planococcus salinus TaxID=1848460 RepID=A0A3M8P9U6_9BACL|nr:ABC transporter permease [Planococcus salinus]RNF40382.1 ABC transporter permease [Planococcus salinus]